VGIPLNSAAKLIDMQCRWTLKSVLMLQYNPEDGRGRTKPISQEGAMEELVQTVR
jgi:hypothetical protein